MSRTRIHHTWVVMVALIMITLPLPALAIPFGAVNLSGVGPFDHIEAYVSTPSGITGVLFTDPSWASIPLGSLGALLSGDPTSNLTFSLTVTSMPAFVDLFAFNGSTMVASAQALYIDGSDLNFLDHLDPAATYATYQAPEPSTLCIFALSALTTVGTTQLRRWRTNTSG